MQQHYPIRMKNLIVLIANALHIMPKPDEAMKEIYRVLKPNGILFAPTFLWKEGKQRKIIKSLMSILGFKMYQEWNKNINLKILLKNMDFQ